MELVSKQWNELNINESKFLRLYNARISQSLFLYKGNLYSLRPIKGMHFLRPLHAFIVYHFPIELRRGKWSQNTGYHRLLSRSSNGFFACILRDDGNFLLYNFLNGVSSPVTDFPCKKYSLHRWLCYGFGYDRYSYDFKIMVVFKYKAREAQATGQDMDNSLFWVYSFRNRVWECLIGFPYSEYIWHQPHASAFNGVLHWVASTAENPNKRVIFTYELSTCRFATILLPQHVYDYGLPNSPKRVPRVGELGGQLCCWMFRGNPNKFELWVMKDYGVRESWTRLMRLSEETGASCLSYWTTPLRMYDCENGGKKVLLVSSRNRVSVALLRYRGWKDQNGSLGTLHGVEEED